MKQVEMRISRIDGMLVNFPDGDAKQKLVQIVDVLRNYNGIKIM